jgi:hypothetical protein
VSWCTAISDLSGQLVEQFVQFFLPKEFGLSGAHYPGLS